LAQSTDELSTRLELLYQSAYCRKPSSAEIETVRQFITSEKSSKQEFEDVLWAIINSKEFLFNH
jgi:hypothetical protein